MTLPAMDRARIAAFVDGELTPEEAAEVAMHLADHPADRAYADDLFAATAALSAAFGAPLREPVPPSILAAIAAPEEPGRKAVLAFLRRPVTVSVAAGAALPLAASVGIAVALFAGGGDSPLRPGPVAEGSEMAVLLDSAPTGEGRAAGEGRDLMVLSTLPTADGFCREVEVVDRHAAQMTLALACRSGAAGWQIAVVLQEPLPVTSDDSGFAAASGTAVAGLTAYLDERGAGLALSAEEEAALIAQNWAR